MRTGHFLLSVLLLTSHSSAFGNPFGTTGALMGANTATNQLDNSWTPQWSDLKAYYRLDGKVGAISSSAIVPDLFGTSNGTTSAAGLSFAAGKLEQGVVFNGAPGISIPRTSPANVCTNLTIMFWIKWNATTSNWWTSIAANLNPAATNGCASTTDYGWHIQQHSNTKALEVTVNTSGNYNQADYTTVNVYDGTWRHVAVTIAASQVKIYIDGTLNKTIGIVLGTGVCSQTAPIRLGGQICDDPLTSGAMMDEFAIFSSVLTAAQITTIYNRQKDGIR